MVYDHQLRRPNCDKQNCRLRLCAVSIFNHRTPILVKGLIRRSGTFIQMSPFIIICSYIELATSGEEVAHAMKASYVQGPTCSGIWSNYGSTAGPEQQAQDTTVWKDLATTNQFSQVMNVQFGDDGTTSSISGMPGAAQHIKVCVYKGFH